MKIPESVSTYITAKKDPKILLRSPTCRRMEHYLRKVFDQGELINQHTVVSPKRKELIGRFHLYDLYWSNDPEIAGIREAFAGENLHQRVVFVKSPIYTEDWIELYSGATNILVSIGGVLFAATEDGEINRPILNQRGMGRRYRKLLRQANFDHLSQWQSTIPRRTN